jgi:hypothetical protein
MTTGSSGRLVMANTENEDDWALPAPAGLALPGVELGLGWS